MIALTRKTDYVEEGLSRLADQYRGKLVIEAFVTAFLNRTQEIEDATYEVTYYRTLAASEGVQLDAWGRFVNLFRLGRNDDDYRRAISIEFLVLRSNGSVATMGKIASLVFSTNLIVRIKAVALLEIRVLDAPPTYDITNGFRSLVRAKMGGVRFHLKWCTELASKTFTFRSFGASSVASKGWGDKVPSSHGGFWSAMLEG